MTEIKLLDIPLFSEMDEQEVAEIRAIMDERKFQTGEVIIREGETDDLFNIVTKGQVEITVRDADGDKIVLQEIGAGGFFGELSMLTQKPRSARVKALTPVTTLCLERNEFFEFLNKRPAAAIDVLIELGGRLHDNQQVLRRMASRNVNTVEKENQTLGSHVADKVADVIGSWPFIIIQSVILTIWIILNLTAYVRGN